MICMYSKGIGFGVKQQPIQIVVSYDVTGHPVYPGGLPVVLAENVAFLVSRG